MALFVFADANIWIHCRPVDQVDWCRLLGVDEIRFVASAPLVRELDKLKYAARTRDRARAALALMESWAHAHQPVELRSKVFGQFWFPREAPNATMLGLDATHPDDVLVTYAHAFHAQHSDSHVLLLTDDSGPRITAGQLSLEALPPPEEARQVTSDETPEEAENRRLRSQLEAMKHRLPRIKLGFRHGIANGSRLEIAGKIDTFPTEDAYVAGILTTARAQAPARKPPAHPSTNDPRPDDSPTLNFAQIVAELGASSFRDWAIDDSEYERYESERQAYLADAESIAHRNWQILAEGARSISVDLGIWNNGTAPADDIDVVIHIPDGPDVSAEEVPLEELPSPPPPPRTTFQIIDDGLRLGLRTPFIGSSLMNLPTDLGPRNVSRPVVRRTNSYDIRMHVGRIKQHQALGVAKLRLIFPELTGRHSLRLDYELNSVSLPRPAQGRLDIVVRS